MYKLKKILTIGLILSMTVILWGCHNPKVGKHQTKSVENMLQGLKNYEADVSITFTKNKDKSNIKMKQVYDMEGKYQIIIKEPEKLKGYKTIYDGEKISEYNPATKKSIQVDASPVRNQLLFGTFVHHYLNGELPKMVEEQLDGEMVYTLSLPIPGGFKYMASEKVWFNQKTTYPIKMEIYDTEGQLTIQIEFEDFKYNTVK